jgi:hypothetical protein
MGEGRSTLSRPILQCEDYTIIDSEVETDCLFATFIQAIYLLQGEDPTNLPKLASDLREWRGACAHSRGWIQEETILEELTGMARRYKIAQRYIALRIRAQRESTLKQAMRALWTTDTIETILIHIPHDERTIPACTNRIWAATVKMLQEYRQRQWKRIFLGVTGLYTWRSHVVDIKVMHNLNQTQDTDRLTKRMTIVSQNLSSASRHMTGTFRTEKGALLNTIKISICMTLAYLIEDGGPDYYRRMVVMNGTLFRTGDINHLLNNPQTYPEQP